jgi:hypothetical protein
VKRYVVSRTPVNSRVGVVGWIVKYNDGSTNFEQRKHVTRGHCVNYGPRYA